MNDIAPGTNESEWATVRLKTLIKAARNGVWGSEPRDDGSDTLCIRVADFDREKLTVIDQPSTYRYIEKKDLSGRTVRTGDLLLEKSGGGDKTLVGMAVQYRGKEVAVCSNFVSVVRAEEGVSGDWLNYLFFSLYSRRINYRSIKQSTGIQNLDAGQYFDERVPVPGFQTQGAIAADLDRETARIDALIEKKTRFIELLKEKRQALITDAISISSTPKSKLGRYVDILPGYAFSSAGFSQEEDDIRLLRGVNVGINELRWSETVRWPANKAGALSRYQLKEGDIVIGLDRPWIASGIRVASVTKADLPSLLLQRVARIRPRGSVIPGYVKLILESKEFFAYFEPELTGISVPHLSTDQVGAFPVSMPTVNEQRDVCAHIELEFQRIDKLMAATDRSTNLLKERRSALITAAVTGQIDLREDAA